MRPAVVILAIRARRLVEGAGKDAGKGLLGIKAVAQTNVVDLFV